jgi:hypothetical protein
MSKIDENLSSVFDTDNIQVTSEEYLPVIKEEKSDTTIDTDYNFARENIKSLITAGNTAIQSLGEIAKISEHPRAFEVFSGMLKNLADLNKDLLDIQAKNNQLTGTKSGESAALNVNQAVFVGSTKDLIQLIKKEEQNG